MTSLDAPDDGLSTIHCSPGEVLTLEMLDADDFTRCKDQYETLVKCADFVNRRRVQMGGLPVLALTFKLGNEKDSE